MVRCVESHVSWVQRRGELLRERTAGYDEVTGAVEWITNTVIGGK
ncbi:hypothetical protein [Sorangium sp. So ce426]